jgi:hypothetical protein
MWRGDGQEHTTQSSEGVSTADCCINGKCNLPKLEGGGSLILVEGMYGSESCSFGFEGRLIAI